MLLVNCSNCHTPLQLPPGAPSIRCALCHAVTLIADPRSPPPPAPHSSSSSSSSSHHHVHHYPPPSAPPPPLHHAPSGPPPPAYGAKRALVCGVSYRNTRDELKGCVNDAKCMKFLLINRFKFPESSILVLTEMAKAQAAEREREEERRKYEEDNASSRNEPVEMYMEWIATLRIHRPNDPMRSFGLHLINMVINRLHIV